MTPRELCDVLDSTQTVAREAAATLGIHETTQQLYAAGRRYPSNGESTKFPKLITSAVVAPR